MSETKCVTRKSTEDYKKVAVKLAKEIGSRKAAYELGRVESTLSGWIHKAQDGEIDLGAGSRTPGESMTLAAELKSLMDENSGDIDNIKKTLGKSPREWRNENKGR
ncbi:MAG: hypothetical protein LBR77_06940 [Lachnospiraceae bacterium]|jgi:transposase|nr:hypothetical protein [Lachnospiraceae bacterium]